MARQRQCIRSFESCRDICQATRRWNGAIGRNSTEHSPQVRTSSGSSLVWLYLHPILKQRDTYFVTDLIILNYGQMTRMRPELVPPSPNFRTAARGRLNPDRLTCPQDRFRGDSSRESGFESGTLRLRSRP
ncbi:hypothetical protein AVEN_100349-1 [Araneus ventricosus]|uniref:Uncharacterized protein n=1 Tax=Araneus ventricosus TaxID=182803 RepID=A0A4Y2KQD0_ARAVE|nr:hypothetical protein AVEN_100349-1 [Araneus ventricosus]